MGLDKLDGLRRKVRFLVCTGNGLGLTGGNGSVDTLGAAVGRTTNALYQAVDAVPIALCILEPLQSDHAQPLAKERSVSLVRERLHIPNSAQSRGLGKAHVHEDVVHGVDTACDDQVGLPQVELVDRHGHSGKGRGTGSIGDAVGTTQVHSVGNATRDDVAQQPREGALLPRNVVVTDALNSLFHLGLWKTGVSQSLAPHGVLQPAHHGAQQLLGGRHAKDDRGPALVHLLELAIRRVAQNALSHDQRQELSRVSGRHNLRRNAPLKRVKGHALDKGAAGGVRHVLRVQLRMHVVILSQWLLGISSMRSTPARMSVQNPPASEEPGNRALTPTIAIEGRLLDMFVLT